MTPAEIDRVFGFGRLRMVTGDHVEVFREAARPGERRRYTKRFLATDAGDFRDWTEREWRILARLVGHGLKPVPDVVRFDRGAGGQPGLVQTYDAGVTVDHWATLLPLERDGRLLGNVFSDPAHWWALARHCLIALDAIHELRLVHLDLKADNVCIPVGPPGFDPLGGARHLKPRFDEIALIDFAFSLVSGEALDRALPIAAQPDYPYQSPRLLQALDAGRQSDLAPTRALDWRCDIFSLTAMLGRYLPATEDAVELDWSSELLARARRFQDRLMAAHDDEAATARPHAQLIAEATAALDIPALRRSLERGWTLAIDAGTAARAAPTPVTRIAPALPLPAAARPDAAAVTPLAPVAPSHTPVHTPVHEPMHEPITVDRSDVDLKSFARRQEDRQRRRRRNGTIAAAALVIAGVPLLGLAWSALRSGPSWPDVPLARQERETTKPTPMPTAGGLRPPEAEVAPAPAPVASGVSDTADTTPAAAPALAATSPTTPLPSKSAAPTPAVASRSVASLHRPKERGAASRSGVLAPKPALGGALRPLRHEPATAHAAVVPTRRVGDGALPAIAPGAALADRPTPWAVTGRTPAQAVEATSPLRSAPGAAVPPAATPQARSATVMAPAVAPATSQALPGAAPARSAVEPPSSLGIESVPPDFSARADELMAHHVPRTAQRAERLVARALFIAGRSDNVIGDDAVLGSAAAVGRAADAEALPVAAREAQRYAAAARDEIGRRGVTSQALDLQARAFGANPLDPEVSGRLAQLLLRSRPGQAEAARELALYSLAQRSPRYPYGRPDDWATFAVASALAGRERDARQALLVGLALAPSIERQCRAALDAYAAYGERLRAPVEAMLAGARASARAPSPACEAPTSWAIGTGPR